MNITIILLILITHWVADFILQSDRMAQGKSTSFIVLAEHVAIYTIVWIIVLLILSIVTDTVSFEYFVIIVKFAGITFLAHLAIDYYTSKVHTQLWKEAKVHVFFISIGFDQLLHYAQLFIAFKLLKL